MDNSDDEVGYGKPPKENQFKPGQSGNPRGRPKGSASFEVLVTKALGKKVRVAIDGKAQTLSTKEAAVLGIVKNALSGTADERLKAVKFLKSAELIEEVEEITYDYSLLGDEELRLLNILLSKAAGVDPDGIL